MAQGRSRSGEVSFHGLEREAGGSRARSQRREKGTIRGGKGAQSRAEGCRITAENTKTRCRKISGTDHPSLSGFLPFSTSCLISILPCCPESLLFSMHAVCSHNGFFSINVFILLPVLCWMHHLLLLYSTVSAAPREPVLLGEGEAGADTVSLRGCEPCRLAPFLQFP